MDSNGLVLAVHTTAVNKHDSKGLIPLLEKIDNERIKKGVFTDKGYASKENREYLKRKKSKDRIQHKAQRNKPLSNWEEVFNKLISKTRGSRAYFWESKAMVWCGSDAFKRLGQGTHTTYFGSYCLQSEAKSEDGDTSCLLMKKGSKNGVLLI